LVFVTLSFDRFLWGYFGITLSIYSEHLWRPRLLF
jgi:hypothetical protein